VRTDLPVYIEQDVIAEFTAYCRSHALDRFVLVADQNTHRALGAAVETALRAQGADVLTVMVEGEDIIADARHTFQVLLNIDRARRTYLGVGSGTLTDIARFVSHRTASEFISLPTAPSVDGFTSIGAPMVIDGLKITVPCHGPLAVFADLQVLMDAPRSLIAAGFGDMLAKLTSVADWELGYLLWDEKFDDVIARRSRDAAWACAQKVDAISAGSSDGIQALMEGLIESGFCMLDFGATTPASGAEHHTSHYWEMKLLREGRHSVLHGAKVGIAVVASLQRFDALRQISRAEAAARLRLMHLPSREAEIGEIRAAYGPITEQVIAQQRPFLDMTEGDFEQLKQKILACWDEIQGIAVQVPPAADMIRWLRSVGGPAYGVEVGLSPEEVALGLKYAHYYRNRFTVGKLSRFLGVP